MIIICLCVVVGGPLVAVFGLCWWRGIRRWRRGAAATTAAAADAGDEVPLVDLADLVPAPAATAVHPRPWAARAGGRVEAGGAAVPDANGGVVNPRRAMARSMTLT
jgi:hypothetical protein